MPQPLPLLPSDLLACPWTSLAFSVNIRNTTLAYIHLSTYCDDWMSIECLESRQNMWYLIGINIELHCTYILYKLLCFFKTSHSIEFTKPFSNWILKARKYIYNTVQIIVQNLKEINSLSIKFIFYMIIHNNSNLVCKLRSE